MKSFGTNVGIQEPVILREPQIIKDSKRLARVLTFPVLGYIIRVFNCITKREWSAEALDTENYWCFKDTVIRKGIHVHLIDN